jgi:hypothetical protein
MGNGRASLLLIIFFISFVFYELNHEKPDKHIMIYVCKDLKQRLFFMGEKEDFNNIILKLGIMEEKSCRPKKMTAQTWFLIRERLKHRNMSIF